MDAQPANLEAKFADVSVNGHPESRGRATPPAYARAPLAPHFDKPVIDGTRQRLEQLGAKGFAQWMRDQKQVLITDTTMRDAHQSLLATRVRTPAALGLADWGHARFVGH